MNQPRDHHRRKAPPRLARRGFILGATGIATAGGAAWWFNVTAKVDADALSAPDTLAAVRAGTLTLIDIRRPDEWARTGVPQGAVPLDMRQDDFMQALLVAVGGDTTLPIALICARGVRSRGLAARLRTAGFTRIINVPEGMTGSGAGPGWIARGLPVSQI